ncbi:MAG: LysR family transcriptional regulator [Myxococcota bacterium]
MDWRDLNIALSVGRHGSLGHAADALSIDPTTVSRRISALERALGAKLFLRSPRRWATTEAGDAVMAHCLRMAAEVRALQHETDRITGVVRGRVRLTAIDAVCTTWLVPEMRQLRQTHPELQLELYATNRVVDLGKGNADVALRLARPDRAGLIARKLTELELVVAGMPAVASLPVVERPISLLGLGDYSTAENDVVRAHGGPVAATATSFAVQMSLILGGIGIGVLPARMAAQADLTVLAAAPKRTLWRATPEAIHDAPRIQADCEWLDAIFV